VLSLLKVDIISARIGHLSFYEGIIMVEIELAKTPEPVSKEDGHMTGIMSHEAVLAVLSNSKEEAKSIKEIARAMNLEITSHMDWIRVEQKLARSLNALTRWGWVAYDRRQQITVPRLRYNAYWKTDLARHTEQCEVPIISNDA
jgi:hypothetical protein